VLRWLGWLCGAAADGVRGYWRILRGCPQGCVWGEWRGPFELVAGRLVEFRECGGCGRVELRDVDDDESLWV
jgi:hypothetical protein